jgi:hypothetical protein
MSRKYKDLPEDEKQKRREKSKLWRAANLEKANESSYRWRHDPNRVVLAVAVNRSLAEWAKKLAKEKGISVANIQRMALNYLKNYYDGKMAGGTPQEVTRDNTNT